MSRRWPVWAAITVVLLGIGVAQADLYVFTPGTPNLNDLPHEKYYKWGLKWQLPTGETITSAELVFKQVWDWVAEPNDHLYAHLLNTVTDPNGSYNQPNYTTGAGSFPYKTITIVGNDTDNGGDRFAGQGVLIGSWNDPYGGGGGAHAIDLSYNIPTAYFSWLGDGNFGFGIDPDCHYYNTGVEFRINTRTTEIVPTPGAACLGLIGLGLISWYRRNHA